MHMQLLHNNKVVMFDRTDFGRSNISLPGGLCRNDANDTMLKRDCTAHSILYDIGTNSFRTLMVQTDTWCSSGAVLSDGILVQTGGFNDGDQVVRIFVPCDGDDCDWVEFPHLLLRRRWYATNQILPDGRRIIIVGGRGQFNYEFYIHPSDLISMPSDHFDLEFLRKTSDESENNLYPFLHLLPDGNLFIFANTRSIVLDYIHNKVEFPSIPGGDPRNYPSTGSSVMLPINENNQIEAEIMVCGGAPPGALRCAREGVFIRASSTCGRLKVTDENPAWKMETMSMARVMGDMLLLSNGDVIIINGASSGSAGWENARNPVTRPVIYKPYAMDSYRFSVMETAQRPRMYHSSAVLLTDGCVLVGGSNPHVFYNFTGVDFPTDLSLQAFSPPYLAVLHDHVRPVIVRVDETIGYQTPFSVTCVVANFLITGHLLVRIIAPSFTTHSFSMNQRMVILKMVEVTCVAPRIYRVTTVGPSTPEIAPIGYYMLFVVHVDIPSSGAWVKILYK
ncbi:hypothetical protein ACH5RR_001288 [Cinchona calisaya]|uniref:Galactose oxidase n=1 Tax=Cinchona calisaya TaxID=153742 RepID=A0ABD3B2Y7_9GENT